MKYTKYLRLFAVAGAALLLAGCAGGETGSSFSSSSSESSETPVSSDSSVDSSTPDSSIDSSSSDSSSPDSSSSDSSSDSSSTGGDDQGGDTSDESAESFYNTLHQYAGENLSSLTLKSTSSSESATLDITKNSSEILVEKTDEKVSTYYFGLLDGAYYALENIGGDYSSGNRYKVVEDGTSVSASDQMTQSEAEEQLALEQTSYSLSALFGAGYIAGLDFSYDMEDAFPATLGETSTGGSATLIDFTVATNAFGRYTEETLTSYDDTSYFPYMYTVRARFSSSGSLSRIEFKRETYSSGSWDDETHAPTENAQPSSTITLSAENLQFVDELPASDPSAPLFKSPESYFMTSAEVVLPGGFDINTGMMGEDNVVTSGSTVGSFNVVSEYDDSDNLINKCTPSDALDSGSDLFMTAPVSGYESYFTEDEYGSWTAVLPDDAESAEVQVYVGNSFAPQLATATITIQQPQLASCAIGYIDGVEFDHNDMFKVSTSVAVGEKKSILFYSETGSAPFDFTTISLTGGEGFDNISVTDFYDDPSGEGFRLDITGVTEGEAHFSVTDYHQQTFNFTISVTAGTQA